MASQSFQTWHRFERFISQRLLYMQQGTMFQMTRMTRLENLKLNLNVISRGEGDSHMKGAGMLVGNFELNP